MNTIEDIKNQLDIVDVISETVKLRRSGKNYTGFCPFHANTRTPAFVVFPDTGTWRCFGECNEGGDIYRYVMKKEGVDFKEALKMLADRAGIQLEPLTPQKAEQNEREEFLRKILEEAVVFFRHQMLNTPEGQKANLYLREKRGITDKTAEIWGLGYAPRSWDALVKHFKAKGISPPGFDRCRACFPAGQRRSLRPIPAPPDDPNTGYVREDDRFWRAGAQSGRCAQIHELPTDDPV